MDEATFNWSNFYGEFATTLLEYKNDRKGLISKLKSAYEETGMKLPKMESNGEILDIDPFTIFGLFNKGITDDNRKRILGEIAKQFNLKNKVPFSFEGIPLVNNLRSTFFNFAEERGENDINNLWEVFESAIRYADNPTQGNKLKIESTYNNVIKQKGIQWNITMGLYWIRPNTYINLDSKNREFIIKQKILPQQFIKEVNQFKNVPNGEQYIQLCDLLLEKIKDGQYGYRDFKELSFIAYERNMSVDTVTQHNTQNTDIAKNTILYGPPGTGKTYNTVMYAVAIIENKKLEEIKKENYTEFIDRYNKYKEDGLIEFTTFHQSYGYEEFIEGIKPVIHSDEEDETDIQYEVVPGLFKKFCDIAGKPILRKEKCDIGINESPTIWKISLEGSGENSTRTECMKNEHIRIGYDEYGREITNLFKGVAGRHILNYFINDMSIGDIVMSCYDCNTVDAIGVVTGEYEWHNEYPEYKRLRKVNWIVKGIKENIIKINNGSRLS
ncbi:MAG: hypothetical protein ACLUOP_04025, partial [Intestinibacter bartlettii]